MTEIKFTETVSLETQHCPVCGVLHAMTEEFLKRKRSHGESWSCPNGHSLSFTVNLKTQLAEAERRIAVKDAQLAASASLLADERRRAARLAAEERRQKKRSRNGVCPCCSRTFSDLRRHMATKHPESKAEQDAAIAREKVAKKGAAV